MSLASHGIQNTQVCEFIFKVEADSELSLRPGEIHVWRRQLGCDRTNIEALREVLSPDELARAARFHFASNRDEFIVSRGTLRTLLSRYLRQRASKLRFRYSQYGRPELWANGDTTALEFNVSHSGGVLVLAFANDRRIGIDVERVRSDFSTTEIAERFFSVAERAVLRELPVEQQHEAFFRCWTRKEAFIKALGEGLSHPLDVSLAPGLPPALLGTRPDAEDARRWFLWDIAVSEGYVGALAAEVFRMMNFRSIDHPCDS